jgi:cell division protein FtsL
VQFYRERRQVIGPGLSHLLSGERQLCSTKSLPPIAIPARFVFLERAAQDFAQVKKSWAAGQVRCAMAASAMAGQQMLMMGARTQSRAESLTARNRELYETQRRARRGPTPEVFFTKHIDNSRIVKADDPERRREMRTFTAVMSVLFLLVMVYVWQHFSAIEIGYHVEAQKTQVNQLQEENRQLRLSEAQLTNPIRIDRVARQLGLNEPQPGQVVRPEGGDPNAPVLAQANAPRMQMAQ